MLFTTKRKVLLLGLALVLQACTQIDDFMLGKDNTPKPKTLGEFKPKMQLVEKWSTSIGSSSKTSTYLKLKPVIRGNIIYTASVSGMIRAVNVSNGTTLWSTAIHHGVVSGPTVAEGVLAIDTDASTVVVLRQTDGKKLWKFKVSSDALSKPLITNDTLIAKTIDGDLYAFSLKTGEKLWVAEHGAPSLVLKASSSPVSLGNMAVVGFSDGRLDAVDTRSGRVVWQRSIAYATGASDVERLIDIVADPIVRGDVIYLASYQGYIGALSLANGEFVFRKPASIYKNMAIDANTIYVTSSDDVIWAYDRQTGRVKWKQQSLKARVLTEPVLMGGYLFVGDKTGLLHVLSTQNGDFLARLNVGSAIDISPAVSGNRLFVMTSNGKLNSYTVK